ncbi:MAG: hypothetical protein WEB06_00770 [Actinomycetota bacterium]
MPAKKKVTPKRATSSRNKKTTKSKAKSKKTGRKTGYRVYSDRNLKSAIMPVEARNVLDQLTQEE